MSIFLPISVRCVETLVSATQLSFPFGFSTWTIRVAAATVEPLVAVQRR
jgi:hypothetical protein